MENKERKKKEIFETIMTESFPKINVEHWITDAES